jgi:hypothetical protein
MNEAPLPVSRSLVAVLRGEAQDAPPALRLLVGKVTAIPDASSVTVLIGGATVTVPRLAAFTPTVNRPAYLLSAGGLTIALGTVNP